MKSACYCRLCQLFCLLILVVLTGCASQISTAPKSVIILLPDNGNVSGEITVESAMGSQVLNRSWQSVEIAGSQGQPSSPVVLDETSVQSEFGVLMSAMPLPPVRYLLYFKQATTQLRPDSEVLIPEIARAVKERHPAQLSVVGHTDTMGTADFNYQLGLLRATSIAGLLASQGYLPASIETASHGKSDLLIKTPDQTHEPRNRRVEVTIR